MLNGITLKSLKLSIQFFLSILFMLLFCSLGITQLDKIAPKYSNEFLAIGVGAEAIGKGNSIISQVEGVNAAYWNPSGLTQTNKWLDASLMHANYFGGIAKYDYFGVAHTLDKRSTIAASVIRFAVDDIPNTTQLIDQQGNIDYDRITTFTAADYAVLLSYARKTKLKGLSVGGNFKIINRKVGDFAKSWGFGIDAGLQYFTEKWKFGLVARDVSTTFNAWFFTLDEETKQVFLNTGNLLPENGLELTLPRFLIGVYRKFTIGSKGIYFSNELNLDLTTDGKRNTLIKSDPFSISPQYGIEIGYKKLFCVRSGLTNVQYIEDLEGTKQLNVQPNIGLGVSIKNIKLDYAYTNMGGISIALYSHILSVRIKLNPPKK